MKRNTNDYRRRFDSHSSERLQILLNEARELGYLLTPEQLEHFAQYMDLLILWNERMNLTSIIEPEAIQVRHFLDSLSCVLAEPSLRSASPVRLIDIGSGAGFPGLPLKIANPSIDLCLADSRGKRVQFLETCLSEIGITGASVVSERAEILGRAVGYRESFDVAVARALGEMPVVLELCLPLIRVGGILIIPARGDFETMVSTYQATAAELGGTITAAIPVTLPGLDDGRGLIRVEKRVPTDSRYPRRPGIPAKRPLGKR